MHTINAFLFALALSASAAQPVAPAPAQAQAADTLAGRPDTASSPHARDTGIVPAVKSSGSDSLKKASDARDTGQKILEPSGAPGLTQAAAVTEDTSYHFWRHPYWGIGAGWGLGSFPLYGEWQQGLPDSAVKIAGPGSVVPVLKVREPVNLYNIFWPLYVSVTPFISERHALSFEGAAYFIFTGKSYKASLTTGKDSLPASVEWSQSCAATFFSLGFDYRRTIPEEYFKVENVQRTTANIGLSVVPLMRFTKSSSFSSNALPDSTIAVLKRIEDNRSFSGFGGSWKIGISSLRRLSPKSGVEIGISYIGRYLGYFTHDKTRMLWKDINPGFGRPDEKVSFLSHTFEISLVLQSGKAPPAKAN